MPVDDGLHDLMDTYKVRAIERKTPEKSRVSQA